MSNIDMIKHYAVQLEKYDQKDLISINNYIESNHRCHRLFWPYEEHIMKRLVDWPKHYSVMIAIENYNNRYRKDLSKGIPMKGFDKCAVVAVYETPSGVQGFWFYPDGIEGDEDIIDSIATELTGFSIEDLQALNDDLGFTNRPLVWYDSNVFKIGGTDDA